MTCYSLEVFLGLFGGLLDSPLGGFDSCRPPCRPCRGGNFGKDCGLCSFSMSDDCFSLVLWVD